jgi:hypothetical protein
MRVSIHLCAVVVAVLAGWVSTAGADNQTATLSPVLPSSGVPFRIAIEQSQFQLPSGLQSFVVGTYRDKWLLLAGRSNGLHGFDPSNDNFPPNQQNTTVFVVDAIGQTVATRSLTDAQSGLTQAQIDTLSVTASQSCQSGRTLYIAGGYGIDTASGVLTTKDAFTAIDIRGLIHWVTDPSPGETAAQHIRQVFHPIVQLTGGFMAETTRRHMLLGFGQTFSAGNVFVNGIYSEQIRRFRVRDNRRTLALLPEDAVPAAPNPDYRRRDLNVVPIIDNGRKRFVAFSGVFTPSNGVWTVPIELDRAGVPSTADPDAPGTFKQAMNNYASATLGFYSSKARSSYTVLMGGISFGFFAGGQFQTDAQLPFINQVTTIARDRSGTFSQHLMDAEFPVILSTASNPGNPLLFGTGATFIRARKVSAYTNGVIRLDALRRKPRLLGYVVGGIQSTLPNTNTSSDSAASPYVFTVTLVPPGP